MTIELAVDETLHEQKWDLQVVMILESDHDVSWPQMCHLASDGMVYGLIVRSRLGESFLRERSPGIEFPRDTLGVPVFDDGEDNNVGVLNLASDAALARLRVIYTTVTGQIIYGMVRAY